MVTALVITLLGAGTVVTTQSFAQSTTNTDSPVTSLVKAIAQKFNLQESDVQAVFDSHRSEMETKRQENVDSKLSQMVTDGKITDAQKQLILAKLKELEANKQSNMEKFKSMTPEERKAVMEKERADLEAWAKQNNIDLSILKFGHGMGMGRGMMKMHWNNAESTTHTPSATQ